MGLEPTTLYTLDRALQHVHVNERWRKEERSKQGQTDNKAKQHSTPKAVIFPKKNELPRVEFEHEKWAASVGIWTRHSAL